MKLTDFTTLALAQAHQVVTDTKKVGSGQARGYLVNTNDLWKTLKVIQADITHPLFSLADAIITTASDAQSYFGMDTTKSDGVANRTGLAILVAQGVMTQVEADGFIAKTISTDYPFATATQAEFDKAHADLLLYVATPHTLVGYPQLDGSNTYAVILAGKTVRLTAVLDTVNTLDTVITIDAHTDDTDTKTFSEVGFKVATITIPAGKLSGSVEIKKSLSRYCQFSSMSNVVGVHNLIVKAL